MIESKVFRFTLTLFVLGMSLVIISCDKDNSPVISNNEILGSWKSTTFMVSNCLSIHENVDKRSCDFSDNDDVDCGTLEFRSDGMVIEDGQALEDASSFTIEGDTITLIDPTNETFIWRFEVSADTLTFFISEFNSPGCLLTVNAVRIN